MSNDPSIQAVYDRAIQDDIHIFLYTPHIVDILAAADAVDPLRQPGMVTVDINDEATVDLVASGIGDPHRYVGKRPFRQPMRVWEARAVLAALARRGETP